MFGNTTPVMTYIALGEHMKVMTFVNKGERSEDTTVFIYILKDLPNPPQHMSATKESSIQI